MAYRVEFTPRAERDFKSLDGSVRGRIKQRIDSLGENPFPSGIKKIEGEDELYRLRVGDYRVLYQVKGKVLLVLIVRIGHRREIYRRIGG
ncbi:MAG: type II toxin-antitoxin system RelE family toxin [Candidatus Binatia bacterium]